MPYLTAQFVYKFYFIQQNHTSICDVDILFKYNVNNFSTIKIVHHVVWPIKKCQNK